MPRNIYYADKRSSRQPYMSEADIDCKATLLLFFKPIRVDAGKSFNKRGFTMIDMACCCEY